MLNVKLVIFVPTTHADQIRAALGEVGAGKIGQYDFCSFSCRGIGRFRGNENSDPTVGEIGKYEAVEEERIEVLVPRNILRDAVKAARAVHPYEHMVFDVYPLERTGQI